MPASPRTCRSFSRYGTERIVRESYFRCGSDRRDDVDVDDAKEARDVEEMVTTGRGVRDEISEPEFVQFETGFRRKR